MASELTPEQRKQRTELIVKIVGLLGVCLVLGPLAGTIAAGLGALAALLVGVAGIFVVWKFIPWFALKIGNARLKAIKAEAMKNPVETLQNQLVEKRKSLDSFKENIRVFAAQVLSFSDEVKKYVKDGLEDAQTYVEQLAKMKKVLELRQQRYKDAEQTLVEFEETIQRTDRKWKMACAAAKMNEAAGEIEGDVFDKICIETAMSSVQDKLNQSFADLEIALMDEDKSKKQIQDRVINVESTPINTPVRQKIAV